MGDLFLLAAEEICEESAAAALLAFFLHLHGFFFQYVHLRSLFAFFLHHLVGNSLVQPSVFGVELFLLGLVLRSLEVVVEITRPHVVVSG